MIFTALAQCVKVLVCPTASAEALSPTLVWGILVTSIADLSCTDVCDVEKWISRSYKLNLAPSAQETV